MLKCTICGRTLGRVECREPYFYCPTRKTVPDALCRQIHVNEQDLEAALLASIRIQTRLFTHAGMGNENESPLDALEKQIQDCQIAISRCKTKQTNAFEDYAEGRITRQEYLSCKQTVAGQQEEMTARYTELNIKKAELKQASGSLEKADLGRYACVTELTRELLVELIKEIRVSGEDALEIVWNFKELTAT